MHLIGLCGLKGVGKSTVAAQLVERGFERMSFAGPIKAMLSTGLGLRFETMTPEGKETPIAWLGGVTPCQLMQTLGTEWGRGVDPAIWVTLLRRRIEDHRRPAFVGPAPAHLVIDDVRFDGEAAMIKELGGSVLRIERAGFRPLRQDRHASERGISSNFVDGVIRLQTRHAINSDAFRRQVLASILPCMQAL